MISYFTEYMDSQLVNMALSLSLWNQYTDGFHYLALKVIPTDNRFGNFTHTLHSEIMLQSPHIKPEYRYSLFGRLWNQKSTLLWYLLGMVGVISLPLQTVLSDLQTMWYCLDG